jgi:uncharacterized protein
VVWAGLLLLVGAVALLPRVGFEYDFGRLDPRLEEYERLQDPVRRVSSDRGRRNGAYIIVDRPEEVPVLEDTLRAIAARDTVIGAIETLQSRFPMTPAAQRAKLARLDTIRTLLDDAFLRASGDTTLALLRTAASTTQPLPLDALPPEFKQAFVAKDGSVGRLVIIYPRGFLSDGRKSMHLADLIGTVEAGGRTYHAGSTSLVAADMLRLMEREAPLMVLLTLVLIVALKLVALRSVRWALLALAPLLMGFVLTFGMMVLLGWKLNFYNMIVLPAILGIGDDAGIHVVHRYREEGRGSLWYVLTTTGVSVAMSAVTTAIGFGGQILSFHPGLRSLGALAIVGLTLTMLTAVVFLPALLQRLEDRGGKG